MYIRAFDSWFSPRCSVLPLNNCLSLKRRRGSIENKDWFNPVEQQFADSVEQTQNVSIRELSSWDISEKRTITLLSNKSFLRADKTHRKPLTAWFNQIEISTASILFSKLSGGTAFRTNKISKSPKSKSVDVIYLSRWFDELPEAGHSHVEAELTGAPVTKIFLTFLFMPFLRRVTRIFSEIISAQNFVIQTLPIFLEDFKNFGPKNSICHFKNPISRK